MVRPDLFDSYMDSLFSFTRKEQQNTNCGQYQKAKHCNLFNKLPFPLLSGRDLSILIYPVKEAVVVKRSQGAAAAQTGKGQAIFLGTNQSKTAPRLKFLGSTGTK